MSEERERLEKHGYRFELDTVVAEAVNVEESEADEIEGADVDDLDESAIAETATDVVLATPDEADVDGFDHTVPDVNTLGEDVPRLDLEETADGDDADTDMEAAPVPAVRLSYKGEHLRTFTNPNADAALGAALRYAQDHYATVAGELGDISDIG